MLPQMMSVAFVWTSMRLNLSPWRNQTGEMKTKKALNICGFPSSDKLCFSEKCRRKKMNEWPPLALTSQRPAAILAFPHGKESDA